MHFTAMLGFGVPGTAIRYDVPLTILSLVVAVTVVGAGLFVVGYGRHQNRALVLAGLATGVGVASMHYIGMAAVRIHGSISYSPATVLLSVLIAIVAATAALWAALNIRRPQAVLGASLVMGGAVSTMHYTGMAAVTTAVDATRRTLEGVSAMQCLFPLIVGLGSFLFLTTAFVALSPAAQERPTSAGVDHAGHRTPA